MKDLLFQQQLTEALTEACGYCDQPAGTRCIDPRTGEPIERQVAHLVRLKAAGLITTTQGGHDA